MKRGGGTVTTQHVEPPSASLTELDAGVDEAISGLAEGEDPDASQVNSRLPLRPCLRIALLSLLHKPPVSHKTFACLCTSYPSALLQVLHKPFVSDSFLTPV
jgi:hypothetical protein